MLGKLPDARYAALDAQYAKEQGELASEITEIEKAVSAYENTRKSAEKFIALIDKYEDFDTLTTTMLNEFVEKIFVHERDRKGSQDTTQEIGSGTDPGRIGGTAEERGTERPSPPALSPPQGKRQAEGMGAEIQRKEEDRD